jgi:hypothetical protein
MKLPLLVTGTNLLSVAAANTAALNYTLVQNRGDVIAFEVATSNIITAVLLSSITITIGGMQVVQNEQLSDFNFDAFQGRYNRLCGTFKGGQSVAIENNNQGLITNILRGQFYHENFWTKYKEWSNLRCVADLSLKKQFFGFQISAGAKGGEDFKVPSDRGEVIAIQPIVYGVNGKNLESAALNVAVDGVTIIDKGHAGLFSPTSSRNNIFPISLENASSLRIDYDGTGTSALSLAGVILYFAPSKYVLPLKEKIIANEC